MKVKDKNITTFKHSLDNLNIQIRALEKQKNELYKEYKEIIAPTPAQLRTFKND